MSRKKSAKEKLSDPKPLKKVRLDKDFAGVAAGLLMLVATPRMVDDYIRAIPKGKFSDIKTMRSDLARENGCDGTCAISTAIFVRIAAEAALEDIEQGLPTDQATPFWRLLSSTDKVTKRLAIDPEWVEQMRQKEAA